jgi:ferredoxin--NADP+ reductase
MANWLEGKIVSVHHWTDDLLSLQFEADIASFRAGQFVRLGLDIDGERVGRPYSLVNSPDKRPCEILFNIVEEGPLSPRLARMHVGDTLFVVEKASGFLILDEIPESDCLWMFATGTAIGPFLSILKTDEPWQRFRRVVLGYSVRTVEEMAYRHEIAKLTAQYPDKLAFVPFVTREAMEGAFQERIPATITSGELEARTGSELSAGTSHVMLCGNAGMIADVSEVLSNRGMKRHRRRDPGHITTEKYH